ncbi:hemolysin [Proteus mirabilis]|uniref:Hemolysin n=1 Tax=Proteus mirabilis TaxID=584 RepID=A0A379GG01_PROMI|nr:hemolysin [Proteus mirabilis]
MPIMKVLNFDAQKGKTVINAGGDLTLAQATDTHSESQSNVNGSANLKVGTTPESKDYGGGFNAGDHSSQQRADYRKSGRYHWLSSY